MLSEVLVLVALVTVTLVPVVDSLPVLLKVLVLVAYVLVVPLRVLAVVDV